MAINVQNPELQPPNNRERWVVFSSSNNDLEKCLVRIEDPAQGSNAVYKKERDLEEVTSIQGPNNTTLTKYRFRVGHVPAEKNLVKKGIKIWISPIDPQDEVNSRANPTWVEVSTDDAFPEDRLEKTMRWLREHGFTWKRLVGLILLLLLALVVWKNWDTIRSWLPERDQRPAARSHGTRTPSFAPTSTEMEIDGKVLPQRVNGGILNNGSINGNVTINNNYGKGVTSSSRSAKEEKPLTVDGYNPDWLNRTPDKIVDILPTPCVPMPGMELRIPYILPAGEVWGFRLPEGTPQNSWDVRVSLLEDDRRNMDGARNLRSINEPFWCEWLDFTKGPENKEFRFYSRAQHDIKLVFILTARVFQPAQQ